MFSHHKIYIYIGFLICRYIDDFASVYEQPDVDPIKVVSHPVNAFKLVKHLSVDWNNLKKFISLDLGGGMTKTFRLVLLL